MPDKQWTDQLPELFEGYTEAEPEGLWDAVQAGLAACAAAPKKKRPIAFWWWGATAVLAAACVALAVILWPSEAGETVSLTPDPEAIADVEEVELVVPEETTEETSVPETIDPVTKPLFAQTVIHHPKPETPEEETEVVPETNDNQSIIQKEVIPENNTTNEPETEEPTPEDKPTETITPTLDPEDWPDDEVEEKPTRFAVQLRPGFMAGRIGDGSSASTTTTGFGLMSGPQMMSANGGINPRILVRNTPSTTEVSHSGDPTYGLTLQAVFHPRWAVETGLLFTATQSVVTTTAGNATSTTTRKMNYIGIPLFVDYNFLRFKALDIYAYGGPMYQRSISTKTQDVQKMGDYVLSDETDRSPVKDDLWSVQGGIGFQLHFPSFKTIHLFGQGGASYHFSGTSDLQESFFTKKPLAPNLTFGVRLSF